MTTDRGVIQNVARAQQVNDFRNLVYGKITPTDLDGLIEYHNKAYVFVEIKYKNKDVPFGQRLAIERLVNDLSGKKKCLAMICEHDTRNTNEHVDVASCKVRQVYFSDELYWREPTHNITIKEAIDSFINLIEQRK